MAKQNALKGRARNRSGRPKGDTPSPIDVHVGSRVRMRRTLLGMSQERLGRELGLTFQQIQKYERGANRIGSSRLFDLSRALDVPVSFFFEEMPASVDSGVGPIATAVPTDEELDPMAKRETLELVRAYYRIPDALTRKRLVELIKSVAKRPGAREGDRA